MMTNVRPITARHLFPQPRWFPQAFDSTLDWVRMIGFNEADYRAASFLDARGVRPGMPVRLVPFTQLKQATPGSARRDCHWIFHISHVGSTLISRLLGEVEGVLPLREPRLLHVLPVISETERADRLPVIRALLARVFTEGQRAMVKATSHITEHAPALVGRPSDGGKALMIRIAPERFVAARLGENRKELHYRAPERLARLTRRIPALDPAQATCDDARLAAMSWAAEATAIEAAAQVVDRDRLHILDFDAFLGDPLAHFDSLARHFDLSGSADALASIIMGTTMSRDSKDHEAAFDATKREAGIAAQLAEHRQPIAAAMRWLESTATMSPLLAAALDRRAA